MRDIAEALQRAQRRYDAGDWRSAEALCTSILKASPQHQEAMELLGIIAARTRRLHVALRLFGQLARSRPSNPTAHINYANALFQAGNLEEALQGFNRALELDPARTDAHNGRGSVLQALGRGEPALESYARAIDLDPRNHAAHRNRGALLWELRRPREALASYERVLELAPGSGEAYYNCGIALQALGRLEDSLRHFDRAVQLQPDKVEAYNSRGNTLQALGRFSEALQSFDRAIKLAPDRAQVHYNRGIALQALGRFAEALQSAERTLELVPDKLEAHANRGVALCSLGRPLEALQSYQGALQLVPNSSEPHRVPEAWARQDALPVTAGPSSRVTSGLVPSDAWIYENRGFARLLSGDLPGGWLDNEWRWLAHPGTADSRYPGRTLWLGRESLAGRTIVLHSEQGLGDTLQFCRYAKRLAGLGAEVILEVQPPLAKLLTSLQGVSRVVVRGDPPPLFDYHCPLLSLPLALGTTLESIPADVPYITSDPGKTHAWADRLGAHRNLRVGLVWASGHRPDQPETWGPNRRRDIPLAKFAALSKPAIEIYSLQKGQPAESELTELRAAGWAGPNLIDFTASLHDFSDTAALVANLDLVISVDTSTAHLAGAMAKPVWLLNRFDTCWRWLLERTDSPWYPSLRIYRQPRPADWDAVVERVRNDLFSLARQTASE